MDWLKNIFNGIGSMFGGGSGSSNMQSTMGGPNSFSKGAGAASQWGASGGNIGKGVSPTSYGGGTDWMSSLFPGGKAQGVAGMALPAIGNMFAPKTKTPDFSNLSSVQALQNFKPGNSVSPEYQQMLQNNTNVLRTQKKRELDALYHSARPGTDYTTDTNYQRDLGLMDKSIQDNMSNSLASAEGQFSSQEQSRLTDLAQLDISSLMMHTGLDFQEAQQFKQMFGQAGGMFLTKSLFPNAYSMNQFGAQK